VSVTLLVLSLTQLQVTEALLHLSGALLHMSPGWRKNAALIYAEGFLCLYYRMTCLKTQSTAQEAQERSHT